MGGLDWSQLPVAQTFYGIEDTEALIEALLVIKAYRAPDKRGDDPEVDEEG